MPGAAFPTRLDAHRRLRGPYTAAGSLARAVVPDALDRFPDLVADHPIELMTIAPELSGRIPADVETLTSLAVPTERTRFYSRLRTLRIAHGFCEFLRDYLRADGRENLVLTVVNLEAADPTDRELFDVLARRLDPGLLTITEAAAQPIACAPDASRADLARRYVWSDCTIGDGEPIEAYTALPAGDRARLHDERATELEAAGELSLRLGAIPYHREHGSDPSGRGAEALQWALDYCIDHGFYDATIDFGERGRALVDWEEQGQYWWTFTTKMTTSLGALSRADEALALYDEARAFTTSASVHMQAAYATAMIYTRHLPEARRDHHQALGWINEAIILSGLAWKDSEAAFHQVFNENGKALVEAHLGRPQEALRLVDEGIARLERELAPDEQLLHRSVLRYNRAQVLTGLGRLEEALADYEAVIEQDPHYAEYHFDRSAILRRLGRDAEALAALEVAMRYTPPFPELYYNRADLLAARGETDAAVADFRYVLELDPDYTDAAVNLAGLLLDTETAAAAAQAREVVTTALAHEPANAHLLSLSGRIHLEAGELDRAEADLDAALAADPARPQAWALRASLAYERGALDAALADLGRAVDLGGDPAYVFNRAAVHRELGHWAQSEADYELFLSRVPDDEDARAGLAAVRARTS